ncbi:MAG: phosphoribosylamine--glycine ligase [Spirochaetales bacterium]|nr:phosphoribosylamine--glycine ligase [Spirochaetales bacterium]
MKVLVLGSGAKDHAIAWMFSKSRRIGGLFIAPGNAGTSMLGTNLPDINPSDPKSVEAACRKYDISYVFAGTEAPLAAGVPDHLRSLGIPTFGASSAAMRLEGDRTFARAFSDRYKIPTSKYLLFTSLSDLQDHLKQNQGTRFVIKKNELAPSRVMLDSSDPDKLLAFAGGLLKNGNIIVEEHLKGMAITLTVLIDEKGCMLFPVCSDYTKASEHDKGAATGGMGSICPVPIVKSSLQEQITNHILTPTFEGLKKEGMTYKGVLIFSIILTENGPKLVDYHVRFNDPATQAMAPLIQSDFLDIIEALQNQDIEKFNLEISNQSSVAVVVASQGYPENPVIERKVSELPFFSKNTLVYNSAMLFYGAVSESGSNLITNGGRCFSVVGLGTNIIEANSRAYSYIKDIRFEGAWHRKDIGNKFFED